jgi:hypothetical protein
MSNVRPNPTNVAFEWIRASVNGTAGSADTAYRISVTSDEEVETRRRVRVRPRFEILGSRGGRAEREKERHERQGPTERRSASGPEAHVESPVFAVVLRVAARLVTTSQSMLHLSASRIVSSASFAPSEA